MLKVYFDNDVISAISRRDWDKAELDAIDRLLGAKRADSIILGASRQAVREMERSPPQYQAMLKTGLSELILAEDDHIVLGFHTQSAPYGGCSSTPLVTDIVNNQLYSDLLENGLKEDDAKHVMYAQHNGYHRFLTCDNGILTRRRYLQERCQSLRIQKPSELVAELFIAES